jgi:hypothetical protein
MDSPSGTLRPAPIAALPSGLGFDPIPDTDGDAAAVAVVAAR